MNITGTLNEIKETTNSLNSDVEMNDLGKTQFCLDLALEHRAYEIFIHQLHMSRRCLDDLTCTK